MMSHEDNSDVGKVVPHPKASLDADAGQVYLDTSSPDNNIALQMTFLAILGAMFGGALGFLIAPALAPAFMIGFAMSFAAARVAFALFGKQQHGTPDEYANGNSRTEEEVRAALAEIEEKRK